MLNYSNFFDKEGMTYADYRERIDRLLAEGKTTGPDHSEAMVQYSKMNVQRMNRLDKTVLLNPDLIACLSALKSTYKLLVISEGWCGDAAQIVPVINKMVTAAPDKLSLKLVLRDQHTDLIDAFLTNGGRAIPIVLFLNAQGDAVMAHWGPRPAVVQALLAEWRLETSDMEILSERLHGWYAKNRTQEIQAAMLDVLKKLT